MSPLFVKVIWEAAAKEMPLEIKRAIARRPDSLMFVMETPNPPLVFF